MSTFTVNPVEIERAVEQLRQERETFDQQKLQDAKSFTLRLVMGYSSVALLAGILSISSFIILNANVFSAGVVGAASGAVFVDAIGLVVSVWKGVLNPRSNEKLAPVTKGRIGGGTARQPIPVSARVAAEPPEA
jgi:hypothetical protein